MRLLDGKKGLVTGVLNDHSVAWGIAQALHGAGAELGFTFRGEAEERRVRPLAAEIGAQLVEPCDVQSDEQIDAAIAKTREHFGTIDILVHSIAFARREELSGEYLATTRAGFLTAMEISAYSLTALVKAALPILNPGASIITMTYYGAEKVIPNYNVMGVAKAALEASVRYLASDLGPRNIRVNAISAGPIRTLAAAGISGFKDLYRHFAAYAPLRRNITIEDVGKTALWLCSDLSSAVTGEVIYVDAGASTLALANSEA